MTKELRCPYSQVSKEVNRILESEQEECFLESVYIRPVHNIRHIWSNDFVNMVVKLIPTEKMPKMTDQLNLDLPEGKDEKRKK